MYPIIIHYTLLYFSETPRSYVLLFWLGNNYARLIINRQIRIKWGNGVYTTYYTSLNTTLSNELIDASKKYIWVSQTELELFQKGRSRRSH